MLLNYYYSSIKDERNLQPIQPCDLENLNRILSNSKKKRCSQRKFGSVKLALDVYRGNMRSCLIIADNSIILYIILLSIFVVNLIMNTL